mgnify:CR=1 FL=1
MEIVLIRHGQPQWMLNDEYTRNPGLTELGVIQAKKSADQFPKGSIDQLWVSPLNRTAQTLIPFEENEVAKEIKTFEWLKEMEDKDEVALYGKSTDEIMSFFEKRNSQTFEEWSVSNHGVYMQDFAKNIITNLEKELKSLGIVCTDDTFDKKFEIKNDSIENLKSFENFSKDEIYDHRKSRFLQIGRDQGFMQSYQMAPQLNLSNDFLD